MFCVFVRYVVVCVVVVVARDDNDDVTATAPLHTHTRVYTTYTNTRSTLFKVKKDPIVFFFFLPFVAASKCLCV